MLSSHCGDQVCPHCLISCPNAKSCNYWWCWWYCSPPNAQFFLTSTFTPEDITSLLLFDTDLLHDWVWWHYCAFVEGELIYYSLLPCLWRIYPGEGWTVSFRASHTLALELQAAKSKTRSNQAVGPGAVTKRIFLPCCFGVGFFFPNVKSRSVCTYVIRWWGIVNAVECEN